MDETKNLKIECEADKQTQKWKGYGKAKKGENADWKIHERENLQGRRVRDIIDTTK